MKETGIIRYIDETNRISIPKTLLKELNLKTGDPVKFYTSDEMISLKRYEPSPEQDAYNLLVEALDILYTNNERVDIQNVLSLLINFLENN